MVAVAVKTFADTAPKYTILLEGIELKFAPLIVTVVPIGPDAGLNELIVNCGIKVNPPSVDEPTGVVTVTFPVFPLPTTALIWVEDTTVKELAGIPPKLTPVALLKKLPVMLMTDPAVAEDGLNELMVGGG